VPGTTPCLPLENSMSDFVRRVPKSDGSGVKARKMKTAPNKRTLPTLALACFALSACAQTGRPQTDRELKGMEMIIDYRLAPGAADKEGVQALTDAGNQMFSSAELNPKNGGVSSFGGGTGMSFPRWVRVTWREDMTTTFSPYTTGKIVGDYTVEVLSRIPPEIFRYVAAAPRRTIVLKFRLKDDGVLFAWGVVERGVYGNKYKMEGGDKVEGGIFIEEAP
jgi:hypothetical protein